MPDDTVLPGGTMRMFQIREDDLAELERLLPQIYETTKLSADNNRARTMWRRVQEIVKDVRWNYGPHSNIERLEE